MRRDPRCLGNRWTLERERQGRGWLMLRIWDLESSNLGFDPSWEGGDFVKREGGNQLWKTCNLNILGAANWKTLFEGGCEGLLLSSGIGASASPCIKLCLSIHYRWIFHQRFNYYIVSHISFGNDIKEYLPPSTNQNKNGPSTIQGKVWFEPGSFEARIREREGRYGWPSTGRALAEPPKDSRSYQKETLRCIYRTSFHPQDWYFNLSVCISCKIYAELN